MMLMAEEIMNLVTVQEWGLQSPCGSIVAIGGVGLVYWGIVTELKDN